MTRHDAPDVEPGRAPELWQADTGRQAVNVQEIGTLPFQPRVQLLGATNGYAVIRFVAPVAGSNATTRYQAGATRCLGPTSTGWTAPAR